MEVLPAHYDACGIRKGVEKHFLYYSLQYLEEEIHLEVVPSSDAEDT